MEFVFSDDLVRDVRNFHSDELRVLERGVEVKIGNVHCHELCTCSRNNTVEQNFGGKHVGSWCGTFTWVIDAVPTHYKVRAIGSLLLGLDGAHELAIGDILEVIVGDVFLAHKLMVLVPFTHPPTPLARQPNSVADDFVQSAW